MLGEQRRPAGKVVLDEGGQTGRGEIRLFRPWLGIGFLFHMQWGTPEGLHAGRRSNRRF